MAAGDTCVADTADTVHHDEWTLEVPCKYNYYCGPTKDPALIRDPVFIFAIMLIPPATKRDQAFKRDQP